MSTLFALARQMKIHLPGVHLTQTTSANGKKYIYCYAWRGGPRLPLPNDPAFLRSLQQALDAKGAQGPSSISALVAVFERSASLQNLSTQTQRDYRRYLKLIEADLGTQSLSSLREPRVRGELLEWRDRFAKTPRKADFAWSVLSRLISFAVDRGFLAHNPCVRAGRFYRDSRRNAIWTDQHLAALRSAASPQIWAAVQLALWTGQRQGDLLALKWSQIRSGRIHFRQSKTDAHVAIRIAPPLQEELSRLPQANTHVLVTSRGTPWTSDGFRSSFLKARRCANVSHLTFHDLRGTMITRMALAGCSAIQIGAVTGHSPKEVSQILNKHYIGEHVALADSAINKLAP